jgi:hypothetical protein
MVKNGSIGILLMIDMGTEYFYVCRLPDKPNEGVKVYDLKNTQNFPEVFHKVRKFPLTPRTY